jgi:hypothetical protein
VSDDWTDLGDSTLYKRFVNGGENDLAGIILRFSDGCRGSIFFKGHGVGEEEWDVLQEDPLTLHPSIQLITGTHQHHGWIRNGRWEEA